MQKSINNNKYNKIKLIKPIDINNNFFDDRKIFPKKSIESKKYLRKIDIELKNILNRGKNNKTKKPFLSENIRKIKEYNLLNDINIERESMTTYYNNFFKNKDKDINEKYNEQSHDNKLFKLKNKTLNNNYLYNELNNITRNAIVLNQKNNTISKVKIINLLKNEKYKLNNTEKYFNIKSIRNKTRTKVRDDNNDSVTKSISENKNKFNIKKEKDNNKDSFTDYSDSPRSRNGKRRLKINMGDLNLQKLHEYDKSEVAKMDNLNMLIQGFMKKKK
jgi:hypothetical protein